MRLWKHGKKSSIAFITNFFKIIQQMKENAGFLTSWLKQIFLTHAHISYQPMKTRVWQYITNQNSGDVTAVFPYSHRNAAIDQWECAYFSTHFIIACISGQMRLFEHIYSDDPLINVFKQTYSSGFFYNWVEWFCASPILINLTLFRLKTHYLERLSIVFTWNGKRQAVAFHKSVILRLE